MSVVRHIMPFGPRVLVKIIHEEERAESGARVLFPKAVGVRAPWDDDLRLLDTEDILATVDEISADAVS